MTRIEKISQPGEDYSREPRMFKIKGQPFLAMTYDDYIRVPQNFNSPWYAAHDTPSIRILHNGKDVSITPIKLKDGFRIISTVIYDLEKHLDLICSKYSC